MRDTLQTKEYFDKGIAFDQMVIDRDVGTVNEIKLHDGRAGQVHDLRHTAVVLCRQRYSRGDSLVEMRPSVTQMGKTFKVLAETMPTLDLPKSEQEMWANFGLSKAYDCFVCLAFLVGLKYEKAELQAVSQWIGYAGQDGLLDRIAVLLGDTGRKVMQTAKFEREYQPLVDLMDAPAAQRPALLKAYVEGWYKRMKQATWHNTHKDSEAYSGYWCFEAALLVMLLNIDDSAVRGHVHYPVDLVNFWRAPA